MCNLLLYISYSIVFGCLLCFFGENIKLYAMDGMMMMMDFFKCFFGWKTVIKLRKEKREKRKEKREKRKEKRKKRKEKRKKRKEKRKKRKGKRE